MTVTDKLLKVTNQITDLRYKLSHPDHFNLSEKDRARSVRQLSQLALVSEKLERLTNPVPVESEITCQTRCNWPTCNLAGCVIKQL